MSCEIFFFFGGGEVGGEGGLLGKREGRGKCVYLRLFTLIFYELPVAPVANLEDLLDARE